MAYQSLNIIGSFTAGTSFVQNQVNADRERVEAYRSLVRQQAQAKNSATADQETLVADVDDRMTIGDAPEEQRTPYFLQRYNPAPPKKSDQDEPATGNFATGANLDTIV